MSKIKVNGKEQDLNASVSIAELIRLNNIVQPSMVSIQLNGKFVISDEYDSTLIKTGDEIDFLYFMGGG